MNTFSFKKPLFIWGLLLVATVFLFILRERSLSHEGKAQYMQAVKEHLLRNKTKKSSEEREVSKQTRTHIAKRVYISEEVPRKMVEIRGETSELGLYSIKQNMRPVETIFDVQGTIQKELFFLLPDGTELVYDKVGVLKKRGEEDALIPPSYDQKDLAPMQRFQHFEAEKAIYDFRSKTFVAYDVNFWVYCVKGHDLVVKREGLWPESTGYATSMVLFYGDSYNKLKFSAENLNMQVTPKW